MKVTQEPDRMNGRVVALAGIAIVAATLFGVLLAWLIQRFAESGLPASAVNRLGGRRTPALEEINGMRSSLYAGDYVSSRADVPRLSQYGWVDRQQQVVFIPLSRAKQLYLERARAAKAAKPVREAVR